MSDFGFLFGCLLILFGLIALAQELRNVAIALGWKAEESANPDSPALSENTPISHALSDDTPPPSK
jgi:hypothetical protein